MTAAEEDHGRLVARLEARAAELAQVDERLSGDRVELESPDGRVRVVANGHGRPLSLWIDPPAVKAPDRRSLGAAVAATLMDIRGQADALRETAEAELLTHRTSLDTEVAP